MGKITRNITGYLKGCAVSISYKINSFPQYGKLFRDFSTLWKIFFHTVEKQGHFFHAMEKLYENFPHNGKTFRQFSTKWKNFFHSVENSVFRLFSEVFGLFAGAVERSTRRPLSTVERDRPRGREKRRPPQAVSALSRSRFGCGVVARPFFWPRGRGSSRS